MSELSLKLDRRKALDVEHAMEKGDMAGVTAYLKDEKALVAAAACRMIATSCTVEDGELAAHRQKVFGASGACAQLLAAMARHAKDAEASQWALRAVIGLLDFTEVV